MVLNMENMTFDSIFWDIQLHNNRYIAFAVNHTYLSEYMKEIGYECIGTRGTLKKYQCPFCRKGYIYVDDIAGSYFTEKCNKSGRLYDLKIFFENKSKEKVASELEYLGKLLLEKKQKKLCIPTVPVIEVPPKIPKNKRFKVGLSYSSEYRDSFISKVADGLAKYFDKDDILYDKFYEEKFSIPGLNDVLPPYYEDGCELVAVFLCHKYAESKWCQKEWVSIIFHKRRHGKQSVIFFHFEETNLPGFDPDEDGSTLLTVSSEDIKKAINFIIQRYDRNFS